MNRKNKKGIILALENSILSSLTTLHFVFILKYITFRIVMWTAQ
jgi:hypothetical protein